MSNELIEAPLSHCTRILGDDFRFPERLRDSINSIPAELLEMSDEQMREEFRPTMVDEKLRTSFWRQVNNLERTGKPFKANELCRDVCNEAYFYNRVMHNPKKMAYMIQPITKYDVQTEVLLYVGMSRLEQIITMDITTPKKQFAGYDRDGKEKFEYKNVVDPIKAKVLLDAINKLEDRVKGSAVQRTVNVNAKTESEPVAYDIESINDSITKLKNKLGVNDDAVPVEFKEKV